MNVKYENKFDFILVLSNLLVSLHKQSNKANEICLMLQVFFKI